MLFKIHYRISVINVGIQSLRLKLYLCLIGMLINSPNISKMIILSLTLRPVVYPLMVATGLRSLGIKSKTFTFLLLLATYPLIRVYISKLPEIPEATLDAGSKFKFFMTMFTNFEV